MTAAFAATLVSSALRKPPEPAVVRFEIPQTETFSRVRISPDGRKIAYLAQTGQKTQIRVRALDSVESQALPGTETATTFFWSPDSRRLAFIAGGKLHKVETQGWPHQPIFDVPGHAVRTGRR